MDWLFKTGSTRRELITERIDDSECQSDDVLVKTNCLAHSFFRSSQFSGILWSVWERTSTKDCQDAEPKRRWIQCDQLQFSRSDNGWGYKHMHESMHPYFYSCPLDYLEMVSIETFGGNEAWRNGVRPYHQRLREKGTEKPKGEEPLPTLFFRLHRRRRSAGPDPVHNLNLCL